MTEGAGSAGPGQSQRKSRFGAVIALTVWALLLLLIVAESPSRAAAVWWASGLLTGLAGLALAIGRARMGRQGKWRLTLGTAGASLLGPFGVALLLIRPVRRSLREAPRLLGGKEPRPVVHSVARIHEPALVLARRLGFGAAALALVTSSGATLIGGLLIALACQECQMQDGNWLAGSLVVTFLVAVVAFGGVAGARGRAWLLTTVESTAASAMVVAIVFLAFDGGDVHIDNSRLNASFLYVLYALIALLFLSGAVVTTRRARALIGGD